MDKRLKTLEKWGKAHKAKDTHQLAKLYTENSVFELKGTDSPSIMLDAKAFSGYNAEIGSDWTIKEALLEKENVHAALTEKNEWLHAAGIKEAHYEGDFLIKDGKIEAVHLKPTRETQQSQTKILAEFSEWVKKEHPKKYSDVLSDGRLLYNKAAGKALVELMHQWQKTR
ncbi:MAG: hypothetical protein ACTSW1_09145 [Candidatus Hodarchaeales archaeon]